MATLTNRGASFPGGCVLEKSSWLLTRLILSPRKLPFADPLLTAGRSSEFDLQFGSVKIWAVDPACDPKGNHSNGSTRNHRPSGLLSCSVVRQSAGPMCQNVRRNSANQRRGRHSWTCWKDSTIETFKLAATYSVTSLGGRGLSRSSVLVLRISSAERLHRVWWDLDESNGSSSCIWIFHKLYQNYFWNFDFWQLR